MAAGPPTRTTIGVASRVEDGQVVASLETRIAATPASMVERAMDRKVDVGIGYFINRHETQPRQQGPFLELGFNPWQRPWAARKRRSGSDGLRGGVLRLTIHGYGELVTESYPRHMAWGGGAGMSATLEAVRFVDVRGSAARGNGAGAGLMLGEIGYGVQLASGYRRVDDVDSWTTTLALSIRMPTFLGIGIAGGIFR